MRRSSPIRVAFDWHDFSEALTPVGNAPSAKREAYQTLKRNNHLLVLTPVMEEEYRQAGRRNLALVTRVIAQARQECRISEHGRGGTPPDVAGLRGWHKRIVQEAIQAGATFLITQWQGWLDLAQDLTNSYKLHVVIPSHYVGQFR